MTFLPLHILKSGANDLGIELTDSQLELFDSFASFLVETNQHLNLTRITEPEEIVKSHYLDSLTCLSALEVRPNARIIDVGTGAGFPGIPIKIVRPDLSVTLTDATSKKIKFISDAVEKLGLENVSPVSARAEEIGNDPEFREKFNIAYARALSQLKVVAELCLPLVKPGGYLVAQKSDDISEELVDARAIIGQLGGKVVDIVTTRIPYTDIERKLIVIQKTRPTPPQFPRAYAKILQGKKKAL